MSELTPLELKQSQVMEGQSNMDNIKVEDTQRIIILLDS